MAKSAMIRARTEPSLKDRVEKIFRSLGLTQTEAINIFYRQVALHNGLPFEVKIPNKETAEAVEAARNGEGQVFDNLEAVYDDLGI